MVNWFMSRHGTQLFQLWGDVQCNVMSSSLAPCSLLTLSFPSLPPFSSLIPQSLQGHTLSTSLDDALLPICSRAQTTNWSVPVDVQLVVTCCEIDQSREQFQTANVRVTDEPKKPAVISVVRTLPWGHYYDHWKHKHSRAASLSSHLCMVNMLHWLTLSWRIDLLSLLN